LWLFLALKQVVLVVLRRFMISTSMVWANGEEAIVVREVTQTERQRPR